MKNKTISLIVSATIIIVAVFSGLVSADNCGCSVSKSIENTENIQVDASYITNGVLYSINGDSVHLVISGDPITQIPSFEISPTDLLTDCVIACLVRHGVEMTADCLGALLSCLGAILGSAIPGIGIGLLVIGAFACWIASAICGVDIGTIAACVTHCVTHGCFLAGTPIAMADGTYKNIEDIRVGDIVKSYNLTTGEMEDSPVTKVFVHTPDEMGDYYLIINNRIRVTPNHPLYANGQWMLAGDLKIDDYLLNIRDGIETVVSIERVYEQEPVYDLEVNNGNNGYIAYFIVAAPKVSYQQLGAYNSTLEIPNQLVN